ncbi:MULTISPECIES: AAA family ATPase [Agrobacterium]|uniref:AAA family ATPase n=4 Tax=Pseudomonadota TaxID=1224 RepID=UPI0023011BFB|nr:MULTISPECIES: AAA family ATPase [Agrobacterium]MDA5631100.1 AAA family ATPase [Agrobacterium sp. ST15.16.055]MDA6980353.1 AAA family ATPase [Agrobacterium salinitolerans]
MPKLPKIQIADTTPSFDEVAVREHVMMLHQLASGLSGKFVVSTFFANPTGEDKAGGVISHHVVGDVEGTIDAVMAHAETPNANTYICPNLMRPTLERGKKGGESDVIAVLALVADLDDDTGRSGTMPTDPNYVVESSPGNYQCFVLLDSPLSVADAKPLARSLKVAANADHCTVDMAHVWRVPGTLNWPNAKKLARGRPSNPAPVAIAELWDGEVTKVEGLRIALQAWSTTETSSSTVTIGELPKASDVEVSETSAEMLAADDVGDRSAHAAKVVEQLAFDGLAAEQACAAFLAATGDWFARYEGKDAAADFARLWGKFGAHHAEERRAGAAAVAGLVAKRTGKDLVAANDNVPNGPTFSIFDWTVDRFKGEPPQVEYLVDGVMPTGVPGMVSAMGDTGKSYAMLELHRRVSFGSSIYDSPIFGGKVLARGTSVMITSEDDAGEVHRRIAALDHKEHRFTELGRKMIVVPLPSAGGAQAFWKDDKKKGLQETDNYRRICDQLLEIDDLRLVTFDPLASFAHLPLNEDPAAGQFVCSSMSRLATETGATVLVAHHMRKTQKPIETLGDARDSIRGSTALVDGLRLAYAMWPAEEVRARKVCKTVGVDFMPGKVVLGGVVKANGAARRVISTYVRNDHGLLVDKTAMLGSATPPTGDLIGALVVTIEAAANAGAPFTKTGGSGVFEMRERLPDELKALSKSRLHGLVDDALGKGMLVRAAAKGEKIAKWLDVPGGYFATGLGSFTTGAVRI